MKLLIVDDEIFAIQGILDSVDWTRLPFESVLTANSYSQALNIFQNEAVDIMVCDIEMPYGSGIDLVTWVRDNHPSTECIFLTCHDEFRFAQQAVSLKCLEYLLKPVPPERMLEVLRNAADTVKKKQKQEQYLKYGRQYVDRIGENTAKDPKNRHRNICREVEDYVAEHITDSLSVEEIARAVYISPDHLTKLFKKENNMSLIDYIISQRMFLAKELLEKNELTVSAVSARVGYANYSYFIKVFKKFYGMTPREYQKAHIPEKC